MAIVLSTYTEGPPQVDGRRYVTERHVDEQGVAYEYEWLGDQDAQLVLNARVVRLNALLAAKAAADLLVDGTTLPLEPVEFMRRFTVQEEAAIRTAAKTDPVVEVFLTRLQVVKTVRLGHPETTGGMDYLVSTGLLTAERSAVILGA